MKLAAGTGTVRFGAIARLRDKSVNETFANYAPPDGTPGVLLSRYVFGAPQTFYDRRYAIGPMINGGVRSLIGTPLLVQTNPAADAILGQQAFQADTEDVYAGYAQYSWSFGKLGILAGIRLEATDAAYGANGSQTDSAGNVTITPPLAKRNYLDYFPSLQARYAFTHNLIGRASYSIAIAWPGFNQATSASQIDFGNNLVVEGNPSLAATTSDNLDVSLAQYLPHAGLVSVGAFDKEFHDYILPNQVQGVFPGITGITSIQSFSNSPSARPTGVELQYIQRFAFLAAPFAGWGWIPTTPTCRPRRRSGRERPARCPRPRTTTSTWR